MIEKCEFGMLNGETVYLYKLNNENGLSAEILTLGGIIKRLVYNGVDVVLGRETVEEYGKNSGYFGAIIGRNSNRLDKAELEINGVTHKLFANQRGNNLHGGVCGFDKKIWDAKEFDGEEPSLVLCLVSPDGDEGFPGEARVTVTYTLTKKNSIKVHYEGICDKDTAMNLTNHSYFNMNGHDSGTIYDHTLWLNCNFYNPNADDLQPNGEVASVKGTPFDFTVPAKIGEKMLSGNKEIERFKGYDHNFVIEGFGYRLCAELIGEKTGIKMQLYTDRPGVQLCAGNYIDENCTYKNGAKYPKHSGMCFETQAFPSWNKYSHFPGGLLKKGEKYDTVTEFKFSQM